MSQKMRHLYLYAHLLIEDANKHGRPIRLEWANIPTASIGPDPKNPKGLVIRISKTAATGSEEDAILLKALIAHEVLCHGNHTDFSLAPLKTALARSLANGLEDNMGEHKARKRFPGSKNTIAAGLDVLIQRGVFSAPVGNEHPAKVLCGWLLTELRSEVLGQESLSGFAKEFRQLAIKHFGTALASKVKEVALQGVYGNGTADVNSASEKILELLKMAKDEAKQQQQQQQQQQGQQQDPDDADDADDGSGQQQDQDDATDSQNDDTNSAPDTPSGNNPSNDGQGGNQDGNSDEPSIEDLIAAIDDALDASDGDSGSYGKGLEDVLCEANEAMQEAKRNGGSHTNEMAEKTAPGSSGQEPAEHRAQLRSEAKATTAKLALEMADRLEALSVTTRHPGLSGRLKGAKLSRVQFGNLKVFERKSSIEELNTVVYLLGDESGSMAHQFGEPELKMTRAGALSRVVVAAGECLANAEIPFGLATYDTSVREWQDIEGDWSKTLTRYKAESLGCTNTHLAVVWAIKKLMVSDKARKILLVITDGDPGDEVVLNAAVAEAQAIGVEVRFVLIGSSLAGTYKEVDIPYGAADTPKDLAGAVFSALEDL